MWGMFRIKRQPKHEPEIISTLEPIYYNSEEALLAFKIQNTIQFESIRERKMPQQKKAKRISIKIKHI